MHHDRDRSTVRVAILTLSDTRSKSDDKSGQAIHSLLTPSHAVAAYELIPDDRERLQQQLLTWVHETDIDVIITNGGTGISERDITYSTVSKMLEKHLQGFGEIFRIKSYEQIGAKAMLSNAIAGTVSTTGIFSLPGSANAVTLAMNELILPILPHFVAELNK